MSSRHRHRSHSHLHGGSPARARREGVALLAFAIGVIALLTLTPMADNGMPPYCFVCPDAQTADSVMNVLLFVPLGVALASLGVRWPSAMALGAAASIAIELTQFFVVVGRIASPLDVLANGLGSAAGVALAARRGMLIYPRSGRALILAAAGAAAWLLVLLLSAIGLRRSASGGALFGQWAPDRERSARFAGRVTSVSVGNLALPEGRVAEDSALRAEMRGGLQVAVTTTAGQPTPSEAPIVRLVDDVGRELFVIARGGSDFIFRTRVAASALGLHAPTLVIPDAFAGRERDASALIPLTGERRPDVLRASAGGTAASLAIHPALGWAFFVPFDAGVRSRSIPASAVWVGSPLLVIGYWIGRRARRRARRAGRDRGWSSTGGELATAAPIIIVVLMIGLGGIAPVFGQRLPPAEVWVAAAAAIGLGIALGVRLAMRHAEHALRQASSQRAIEPPGLAVESSSHQV